MSKTPKEIANDLEKDGMACNCDLDWREETGHSWVCRIHKEARRQYRVKNGAAYRKGDDDQ